VCVGRAANHLFPPRRAGLLDGLDAAALLAG
jgi:hypothetical protein